MLRELVGNRGRELLLDFRDFLHNGEHELEHAFAVGATPLGEDPRKRAALLRRDLPRDEDRVLRGEKRDVPKRLKDYRRHTRAGTPQELQEAVQPSMSAQQMAHGLRLVEKPGVLFRTERQRGNGVDHLMALLLGDGIG